MVNPHGYEPVLSAQAAVIFAELPKSKQRKLLNLLFRLAQHPNQPGDFILRDETGSELQCLAVGEWYFTYWPDHAVKELRIVDVSFV